MRTSHVSAKSAVTTPSKGGSALNPKLLVIGSVNYDLMFKHERLPEPGESLVGAVFYQSCGGKGANQAVVASRCARILGSRAGRSGGPVVDVAFAGAVGRDVFGDKQRQMLSDSGVDVSGLLTLEDQPTGTSSVWIETSTGENRILSSGGANERFTPDCIADLAIEAASLVLMPNEIPAATLRAVAERAVAAGVPMIWNPAPFLPGESPAVPLSSCLFVTPNEVEAGAMVGDSSGGDKIDVESAVAVAQELVDMGAKGAVVTLGAAGVVAYDGAKVIRVEAPRVEVVDTTGAGDALSGAFAAALLTGRSTEEALRFAVLYASESVRFAGTQSAYPWDLEHPI